MRHNTALTSKESYSQHVSSGNKLRQRQAIMETVKEGAKFWFPKGMTRRQIAYHLDYELGATAGRVNLLIKDGLLVDKGTVKCSTTGKTVGLVGLPEKQGELYD